MDPMKPTRVWSLVAAAVVSAAVGWGLVQVVDAWLGRLVPVPWLAAAALWLEHICRLPIGPSDDLAG
jgi:hypothetical protein